VRYFARKTPRCVWIGQEPDDRKSHREKANEIFFEKNKELTDSGVIPAIARFGEASEV